MKSVYFSFWAWSIVFQALFFAHSSISADISERSLETLSEPAKSTELSHVTISNPSQPLVERSQTTSIDKTVQGELKTEKDPVITNISTPELSNDQNLSNSSPKSKSQVSSLNVLENLSTHPSQLNVLNKSTQSKQSNNKELLDQQTVSAESHISSTMLEELINDKDLSNNSDLDTLSDDMNIFGTQDEDQDWANDIDADLEGKGQKIEDDDMVKMQIMQITSESRTSYTEMEILVDFMEGELNVKVLEPKGSLLRDDFEERKKNLAPENMDDVKHIEKTIKGKSSDEQQKIHDDLIEAMENVSHLSVDSSTSSKESEDLEINRDLLNSNQNVDEMPDFKDIQDLMSKAGVGKNTQVGDGSGNTLDKGNKELTMDDLMKVMAPANDKKSKGKMDGDTAKMLKSLTSILGSGAGKGIGGGGIENGLKDNLKKSFDKMIDSGSLADIFKGMMNGGQDMKKVLQSSGLSTPTTPTPDTTLKDKSVMPEADKFKNRLNKKELDMIKNGFNYSTIGNNKDKKYPTMKEILSDRTTKDKTKVKTKKKKYKWQIAKEAKAKLDSKMNSKFFKPATKANFGGSFLFADPTITKKSTDKEGNTDVFLSLDDNEGGGTDPRDILMDKGTMNVHSRQDINGLNIKATRAAGHSMPRKAMMLGRGKIKGQRGLILI